MTTKAQSKRVQLANRITKAIWWSPSLDRDGELTGVAHAIHDGVTLCGAKPFDMGPSYAFAIEADCRECKRCRHIICDVQRIRSST